MEKGVPYWSRPDLGIGPGDVKVEGGRMKVTVHSLGSVDAPASKVVLRDRSGKALASAKVSALKAPWIWCQKPRWSLCAAAARGLERRKRHD